MPSFMLYALIAGLSLTSVTGALGSLVLWRKMAYFGDTLSHASMLGIALGVLFNINLNIAIILCCLIIALVLAMFKNSSKLPFDSILGILSPSSLALSLVLLSFMPDIRIDVLFGYLFGDLLAINKFEVIIIGISCLIVLMFIIFYWRKFLAICIDEQLAKAEGLHVNKLQLILMLLIALIIALAMKAVGVLLITALLIIPAASAKNLAKNPEQMAVLASVIGYFCIGLGLLMSWYYDTPAGPSVVTSAFGIFLISLIVKLGFITK